MLEYKQNMKYNQITHRISASSVPILLLTGIYVKETAIINHNRIYYKKVLPPAMYVKELDRFNDFSINTVYIFHRSRSCVYCRPTQTLKDILEIYRISLRDCKRR